LIPLGLLILSLCGPQALAQEADAESPGSEPPVEELPPLLQEPELIDFVQAPYPPEAEAAGVEGSVLLLIEVDETGAVTLVEILEGAGQGFDEAAVEAAAQFRFTPAVDETGPVPVALEFAYGFTLAPAIDEIDGDDTVPETTAPELAPVTLEGTLVEMGTRSPLADVYVSAHPVDADSPVWEGTTDAEGRFALRGVPPGEQTLTARYPGYKDAEIVVEVVEGEVTDAKIWLRNLSYRDDEALIVYEREREPEVTRRTISVQEIRRVPGTFGDPVRVIQNLPGAARAPFGSGVLIIRGSNPEDSNVYVDGIEVPLIYHLGGYVSVINADLIESVDYLPGGYGVRYGRSTGGVIDVETKRDMPERKRIIWSTDILDSGGLVEGRFGKNEGLGLAVAARRSYIDVFLPAFTPDAGFILKPRWYDYQAKAVARKLPKGSLSVLAFGFQDLLILGTPDDVAQGTDADFQGDLSVRYQTHRLVLSWERPLTEALSLEMQAYGGLDSVDFGVGTSLELNQEFETLGARAALGWKASERLEADLGVDLVLVPYKIELTLPFNPESFVEFDPLSEREDYRTVIDGVGLAPDPYISATWRPLPDPDQLLLLPGARLNVLKIDDYAPIVSLDPRLAARARLIEGGTVKAGTGIYQQGPQGQEFGLEEDSLTLGFERAWSSELGWEQQLGSAISVDVTGFYKKLDHLIVDNPDFETLDDPVYVNAGIGRIYGLEFMARHALNKRFFGWVSYTLSRSDRLDNPNDPDADWLPFDFDQRHILVAVAGYDLPRDFGISAKFQHVTGNPYTPYDGAVYDIDQDSWTPYSAGAPNSERLPPFTALDLRFDRLKTYKRWQLETYVDLLNVYRGENPEQVQYNYDYTESTFISGLPFVPSFGFEAEVLF